MSKRACVQTSVEEQVKKLKVWQQNKGWSLSEAARALSVKPNTLLGWRDKLSNSDLSFIKDPSTISGQYRKSGGGRPHKVSSYESRVVEFYENCIRDGGIVTSGALKTYCKNIEEFALLPSKTQASWIRRFLDRCQRRHNTEAALESFAQLESSPSDSARATKLSDNPATPDIEERCAVQVEAAFPGEEGLEIPAECRPAESEVVHVRASKKATQGPAVSTTLNASTLEKTTAKKIAKRWPHLSLKLLEDAVKVGAPYVEFAARLRQLKVVTLERATISVASAAKVTATPPDKLVDILPRSVLASCGKRIDAFIVKWKKTRGVPIKRKDVVVTVSSTTYSIRTIDAMNIWYRLLERYDDLDGAMKWVASERHALFTPNDGFEVEARVSAEDVSLHLLRLRVLHEEWYQVAYAGKELLDEACLDQSIVHLIRQYRHKLRAVALPANVLRLPLRDVELEVAQSHEVFGFAKGKETPPALLMVVSTDRNHWCGVICDPSKSSVLVFDPQQCGDRIVSLIQFLQREIDSLLPARNYRYRTYSTFEIRDNYNCGVAVLLFFETFLSGMSTRCVTGRARDAMQFFRYRYLGKYVDS